MTAPTFAITTEPPPPEAVAHTGAATFRLSDGRAFALDLPYPIIVFAEGASPRSLLGVPRAAADRIDAALLDLVSVAEAGKLADDGTVPIIVRVGAPAALAVASILVDGATLPRFEVALGRVAVADLPALALTPGVEKVFLDGDAQTLLGESVPLVRADEARERRDPLDRPLTGLGVTIAIIDTGIDHTHPDLGGCFGPGCKVRGGYDFLNADEDPMDDHGHGTHVGATAAGVHGVAPDAELLAYKVCNEQGLCPYGAILAAIDAAVAADADVISISLGGPGHELDPLALAVDRAVADGVVVVSAAGNSGSIAGAIGTPAAARSGIAVGATDKFDQLAGFSSRGPTVFPGGEIAGVKPDIVAPGVAIRAAVPQGSCLLCDASGYLPLSGTSMAAPHVSGAAALLIQARPHWAPTFVKSALVAGAVPLGYSALEEGAGRLDVIAALDARIGLSSAVLYGGVDPTSRETYSARVVTGVVNLGDEPLYVRASGGHEGIEVRDESWSQPLAMPLPPGLALQLDLRVVVDNAKVADGWAERSVRVEGTVDVPPELRDLVEAETVRIDTKLALFKTGVLYVSYEGAPWVTVIAGQHSHSFSTSPNVVYAPPDVLDAVTVWDQARAISFVDEFIHDGESNLTIRREHNWPTIKMDPVFENGTRGFPPGYRGCGEALSATACYVGGGVRVLSARSTASADLYSTGPFNSMQFGPTSGPYVVGFRNQYRVGDVSYVTMGAAPASAAPADLTPEATFSEGRMEYRFPSGPDTGLRHRFCTSNGFGWGADSVRFTEGWRSRLLVAGADVPLAPTPWGPAHPTNCEFTFDRVHQQHDAAEPPCTYQCRLLGYTIWEKATPDGIRMIERPWLREEADTRYATRDGAFVFADGAPSFGGRITQDFCARCVDITGAPDLWTTFMPGSASFTGHSYFRDGTTSFVARFDGEVLAAGELANFPLIKRVHFPWETGRIEVDLAARDWPLDGFTSNTSYRVAFNSAPGRDALRIDWARVNDAVGLGSRFGAAAALTLHVKAVDPADALEAIDVVVRHESGASEAWSALVPGMDGLVHVDLPAWGEGRYAIEISARSGTGAVASLVQDPAFVRA